MENLELNYLELSFIMNMKSAEAKFIFCNLLSAEKVRASDLIKVSILKNKFKPIRSVDLRYDGINELIFNLQQKPKNYKKYLSVKSMVKVKKFTSGKTVFYKICTEPQLSHAKEVFNSHFKFMFPKGVVSSKSAK